MAGDLQGGRPADPDGALVAISTGAGRPLGYGFLADALGTVLTADEVVAEQPADGVGLRVRTAAGTWHEAGPGTLTRCPELGLAWLTVTQAAREAAGEPLPVAETEAGPEPGRYVLIPGAPAVTAAVRGAGAALTTGAASARLLTGVLLLELPPGLAPVPGLPVLDPDTGVVLGLLAPGLRGLPAGLTGAIPLATARSLGPPALAELLARNAVAAPAYGHSLNLGGALGLTARQLARACAGPGRIGELAADRVERSDALAGEEPTAVLTVLVGEPGSGRSTELAALAVRRSTGARPLPTLWLRGADLWAADRCLRAPLGRSLARLAGPEREQHPASGAQPAGEAAAGEEPVDEAAVDEAAVARVCAAGGRPLLVVLDGPEEAAGVLGAVWWTATIEWLVAARVRLLVACRPETWERYGPQAEAGLAGSAGLAGGPGAVRLHRLRPLAGASLELVAQHYDVTIHQDSWGRPAVSPSLLRLAGELRAAGVDPAGAHAAELYQGWLDLRCLRIAGQLAREGDRPASHRKGSAVRAPGPPVAPQRVRRLAAVVSGRVHEAARRMLGAGQGGLGRTAFEELFPRAGGWARAVLADGLFVPVGDGYRLAHEQVADWLQGLHLDLDAALRLLLADGKEGGPRRAVPRHRVGAVEAALHALAESRGAAGLDPWLHRLWNALTAVGPPAGPTAARTPAAAELDQERRWWAARLLATALRASPEPTAHQELLQQMAERIADAAARVGGFAALRQGAPPCTAALAASLPAALAASLPVELARFGPEFWDSLALPADSRWALLRSLCRADGPEQGFLASAADRLAASGAALFPLLCHWFEDGRALSARPGAIVADLAHDLLHLHRALAVDELTEALVAAAHPRADALLTVLAVEEPSALCRAVDRWSHDPRPERHVAAAVHALRAAPYATGAGTELLRHTALTLLARETEPGLHGAALALLVRDPVTRARHLPGALRAYAADDPFVSPAVLAVALATDAAAVLDAFEARLALPGGCAAAVLRVLTDAAPGAGAVAAPGSLPDPATRLAGRLLRARPERAELVAEYLNRRLALGTAARGDLTALLGAPPGERPAAVRRAFALVLATPGDAAPTAAPAENGPAEDGPAGAGSAGAGPVRDPAAGEVLRGEFLDRLLVTERDPVVLAPALERLANTTARQDPRRARAMVRRIADAWAQGAGGPERWDALLVRSAGRAADFAQLLAEWPADSHPPTGGPLLARMRVLVAQGRDPQYAAAEAERTAVRPVTAALPRAAGVPVPERGPAHGTL